MALRIDSDGMGVVYKAGQLSLEAIEGRIAYLPAGDRMALPEVNATRDDQPQISTDGWHAYPPAVLDSFGSKAN